MVGFALAWRQAAFSSAPCREVDATGAGDIFAAAFFARRFQTRDAWEAARFATNLAAYSVTRVGLQGIPTHKEIEHCKMEVLS
jgi:sugar/nucleoside kinase (ribokinase family)